MLYVYASNLRTGKFEEFQKWINSGSKQLNRAQPSSWKLRGIYLTAFGLGQNHVEVHWEIPDYAAFDVAREAADKNDSFNRFLQDLHSFLDPATGNGRILKSAVGNEALIVGC